ncbi:MAG: flagellar basal body rod protein FlgB [Clostridia bacterium]|nr:flagellar basal body rod protein FlgB [Clostridia bacterium]
MINKLTNTLFIQVAEKGLDAAALRQNVIANNLSNVDTPGFKRSFVTFEEELKAALAAGKGPKLRGVMTDEKHLPIGPRSLGLIMPQTHVQRNTSLRNDGNNVDIDEESANLAKNSIMYNALAQQIAGDFSSLRNVISEGRR